MFLLRLYNVLSNGRKCNWVRPNERVVKCQ